MAISLATWTIELELAGRGNGWTDVSSDLMGPIHCRYGLPGVTPTDLVATTGTLTFTLNNSSRNSGSAVGYYSPGHASCRSGFDEGIGVRFSCLVGSTRYYKFNGTIDDIEPQPDVYGNLQTAVTCVDWMDYAAKTYVSGLTVQINKSSDQLIATVLASLTYQPPATSIGAGQSTFPYAFDNVQDESTVILQVLQDVCNSERGFVYIKGDTSGGGTLVFESRKTRALLSAVVDTFDVRTGGADRATGLQVQRKRDDLLGTVMVTTHPRAVDAAATAVLYKPGSPTTVPAGGSVVLQAPYRDPNQQASRVGGINMVAPVSGTDFTANTAQDFSGTNVTSSVSVSAVFGGNSAAVTITNSLNVPVYVLLQLRGQGIYDYQQTVGKAASTTALSLSQGQTLAIDMPFEADPNTGTGVAHYLLGVYDKARTNVQTLQIFAPAKDSTTLARILARDISDAIGIKETVTGISTTDAVTGAVVGWFINAVDLSVDQVGNATLVWTLAPSSRQAIWQLAVPGKTELGLTTVLGSEAYIGHVDTPHGDSAHTDTPHGDVAHGDVTGHTDAGHTDIHDDSPHGDSDHVDTSHTDSAHTDTPHEDDHTDIPHGDVPHFDGGPDDTFVDTPHDDSHDDTAHGDVAHGDVPHGDVPHSDVAHSDDHGDVTGHTDASHTDTPHTDTPHGDVPHSDVGHGDA